MMFGNEEFERPARSFQMPASKMVGWVIKYSGGYIKNKNQANYVLMGFVVLAIAISLFLFFGGGETQIEVSPVRKF